MIGPHTGKALRINEQREIAVIQGWGAFQTNFGQTQSFDVPQDVQVEYLIRHEHVFWSWHVSYLAAANPNENIRETCARYLGCVAYFSQSHKINCAVVHTGAVSGKLIGDVMSGMEDFFENWQVRKAFENCGLKLAVEHGASTCGFNLNPEVFARQYDDDPTIGWCLDLAHAPAAGVGWETLRRAIKIKPPTVCHANFPGSEFGSSRDVHGWRSHPHYVRGKNKSLVHRDAATSLWFCEEWNQTVRMLHDLGVPLIVEGSGFPDGSVQQDMEIIRDLVKARNDD